MARLGGLGRPHVGVRTILERNGADPRLVEGVEAMRSGYDRLLGLLGRLKANRLAEGLKAESHQNETVEKLEKLPESVYQNLRLACRVDAFCEGWIRAYPDEIFMRVDIQPTNRDRR